MNQIKQITLVTTLTAWAFVFSPLGWAEEVKGVEPVVVRTMENASGEVARFDGQMINVIYSRTENAEYEIAIPIDKEAGLQGYKKASDILAGDQVELIYEKTVTGLGTTEEKREMAVKKIRFIKRPSQDKSLHSKGESR